MHIILGVLGTIVTILILLNRLADAGIDLGGLNPFLWHRRRKWKQQYQANPIYKIVNPMDATALLMAAIAKCDGDMSTEQKRTILSLFEKEFHLSRREASSLLTSSIYLLKDGEEVKTNLAKILAPSWEKFTREQTESALSLIDRVARSEGEPSQIQNELIEALKSEFSKRLATDTKRW